MNDTLESLEKERMERLKELGYLCYNISLSDETMSDFGSTINGMRACAVNMMGNGAVGKDSENCDTILDKWAVELGCACFNEYIDKKLMSGGMAEICDSIASINLRITEYIKLNGEKPCGGASQIEDSVAAAGNVHAHSELRVNYPYGMEPIPTNAKQCSCGYRNRAYAVYCGKCGTKL